MSIIRLIVFLALSTVIFGRPAVAWEADMHYGLIKWLAYQAGFSLRDAEIVAASSQSADETHVLMATYLIAEVCARGKAPKITTVSRVVQQHHFPAPDHVPDRPANRDVVQGRYGQDGAGNRWVRQEIGDRTPNLSPVVRLERFGSSFHALADSWSHAGQPDVPDKFLLRCRQPELVWSHPAKRGGWESHDADITHRHPQDTRETAESAYRYLLDFLKAHPRHAQRAPAAWSTLRTRVEEFARRKTRDAKYDWFLQEDQRYKNDPQEGLPYNRFTTYPCFLRETSLPRRDRRDGYARMRCADPEPGDNEPAYSEPPSPAPPLPLQNDPDSPWVFTYSLLETWFVQRNLPRLLNDMTDVSRVARGYANSATAMNNRDYVSLLLEMWLVDDHGLVNALGHGGDNVDALRQTLSNPARALTAQFAPVNYETLDDAARRPDSSLPFDLIRNDYQSENADGEAITVLSYLVTFSPAHAPRDLLLLTIERQDDAWQLTSIAWALQ